MRDYHDLYQKTDVLLLADVFEEFREVCLDNYQLDPAWYYTTPGLSWNACLKITGVKLELLHDQDMLLMVEKGIPGGVSMISTRYGKTNNKYMKEYDPSEPSKYIIYLDANNLYGWAMSKKLPTHGFKWMKREQLANWEDMPCILEVDLEYPRKKLGEILPGMIGAIASFIFRTAGEVIGFLAKNAWLLIVGLVVFAVEQFKNKNKLFK